MGAPLETLMVAPPPPYMHQLWGKPAIWLPFLLTRLTV